MRRVAVAGLVVLLAIAVACAQQPSSRDVLYQTSTIGALLQGVYDGRMTIGDLRAHGDLGLGTVNALDGELIVLDGRFLTVDAEGAVHELDDAAQTPFAAVTWFGADAEQRIEDVPDLAALQSLIDRMLPTPNLCYAIRITGDFGYVRTRSVPRQERPYPPLAQVVAEQPIFEFAECTGTLVGFRLPEFISGVNVPGYHLHFLTGALDGGGHLLECRITQALIEIDRTEGLMLALPTTRDFYEWRQAGDDEATLEAVER